MELGSAVFGYVVCRLLPDGSHIGGVLVTDVFGLPLEFRHTDPVTPSRLQRVLYGGALEGYIASEVLVGALLSSVAARPEIYIAGDSTYVDGAGEFGSPSIWIAESRAAQDKETGHRHDIGAGEFILQLGPGSGAVRVKVGAPRNAATADYVKTTSDIAAKLLLQASQSMEVLEPLSRVEDAIQMLWDDSQSTGAEITDSHQDKSIHPRKAA
jgi:hypothetical protein